MVEKLEGLPRQHFFTHHEEPRSRNFVSEYDDKYNRHSYNPVLPPLRKWSGPKSSWIPQKSDFPITEPPTNYGLLEHLMKKWHKKEAGVMNSVYTISYETPPIPAVATCHRRRPPKTPGLSFIQRSPPQNEQDKAYTLVLAWTSLWPWSAQFYFCNVSDTVAEVRFFKVEFSTEGHGRFRCVSRATVAPTGKVIPHQAGRDPELSAGPMHHKATLVMKSLRDARALLIAKHYLALLGLQSPREIKGNEEKLKAKEVKAAIATQPAIRAVLQKTCSLDKQL